MSPLHIASALLIVAMWGLNFTVIRFGLDEFTPFTFATWRFVLGALPILFVPKPAISWGTLAGIGAFVAWIPLRIAIWLVRDEHRALVGGGDAALRPGQVFGALVIAAGLGLIGGFVAARVGASARSAPGSEA